MFLLNNQPLSIDSTFTHNGISYPTNWLRLSTTEEKKSIGIIEVSDPDPIDYRFYNADGTKKDFDELKNQYIFDTK